jgi:NMD protein affecting ribosome stability and mRNA decay
VLPHRHSIGETPLSLDTPLCTTPLRPPRQPPKAWVRADLESKELLTFCVKKVKGLNKVKLVDAGFLWTEPHSRRLKVKVTIQKEVLNGAILQQTFVVEVRTRREGAAAGNEAAHSLKCLLCISDTARAVRGGAAHVRAVPA